MNPARFDLLMIDSRLFTLALLGGLVLGLARPALAADSLCTGQETVEFNCQAGRKLISVCASKGLDTTQGYLQYRYGAKGKLEIQVPFAPNHPNPLVRCGTLAYSGGGGAYLRFLKGDYRYVVYSATGKAWGSKAGVAVEQGGRLIRHVQCQGKALSRLGTDLFVRAGMPVDDQTFQLP